MYYLQYHLYVNYFTRHTKKKKTDSEKTELFFIIATNFNENFNDKGTQRK